MRFREIAMNVADHVPERLAVALRSDSGSARALRPMANWILPSTRSVMTVRSGAAKGLSLPIDLHSEKYYWTGTHEQHVQELLLSVLASGDCFWDIGAHIGFFSAIAARQVGPDGSVVSFEPMPETRGRLEQAVALNGFENVTIKDCAVADSRGQRTLHPPLVEESGTGSIDSEDFTTMWTLVDDKGQADGVEVACETIDHLAREMELPDLIKIDAEGAEIEVLAGGLELLSRRRTKVLIEMSDQETLERGRALLPDFGFELVGANHWLLT